MEKNRRKRKTSSSPVLHCRTMKIRRQPIRPNMDTSSVDLPQELIEFILSKCPFKSVVRFKSVSKSWQSIISDPRFSKIHHIHWSKLPANQNKFLFWAEPEDSYNSQLYLIGLEDGKFRREPWSRYPSAKFIMPLSSCDGLILIRWRAKGVYMFWNPFTGKDMVIPNPKLHMPWNADGHLYYDSVTDDYKIVYLYEDCYTVYSCKNGSWGEIKDFPCDRFLVRNASVDGCMYGKQRDGGILSIMCFDVREGKVHEVPMPEGAECLDQVRLKAVSGRLSLYGFTKNGRGLQLWVMERNNDYCRTWRKLISMEKQGIHSHLHYYTCPICLSNEDDVVLWSNGDHFIYNSRQKSLQKANFTWKISHDYFPYQENLYLMP